MDIIDKLIKSLEEVKTELAKADAPKEEQDQKDDKANLNNPYNDQDEDKKKLKKEELMCAANGQWNLLEKDAANPKLAPKEVKVKKLQAQIDAGTYKPDAAKIANAMKQHPDKPLNKADECHEDPKHEEKEKEKASKIKEQAEEILDLHKK